MSGKFGGPNATVKKTPLPSQPMGKTKGATRTYEGGVAYEKGDKLALYTLSVTNMVGETTFYESAPNRDNRFRDLVRTVAVKDPEWMAKFIPFLRDTANMRSASVVAAVEAAKAILMARAKGTLDDNVSVRGLISSACSRADEPAEILGYWDADYGRPIPNSIRRGIGDAAVRLYNEYSALKYDTTSRGVRMAQVLSVARPVPKDSQQAALFSHLIDRYYGRADLVSEELVRINTAYALDATPKDQRRNVLRTRGNTALADAGYTWERLSGWLPGGMDAEAWEAIIPNMGYMALLRNLRNFEEKGVSKEMLKFVRDKLEDPEEVARSRQFPYRFYTAWRATNQSIFFGSPLETGLDLSCNNIPALPGITGVFIDSSQSMRNGGISADSTVRPLDVAALFGAAVAVKNRGNAKLFHYASMYEPLQTMPSVLRTLEHVDSRVGKVGHGTDIWGNVNRAFREHGGFDRVIVLTDGQGCPTRLTPDNLPANVPVYVWDVQGYRNSGINTSTPGRYLLGGFSDAAFRIVALLDAGRSASWPWES